MGFGRDLVIEIVNNWCRAERSRQTFAELLKPIGYAIEMCGKKLGLDPEHMARSYVATYHCKTNAKSSRMSAWTPTDKLHEVNVNCSAFSLLTVESPRKLGNCDEVTKPASRTR